MGFLDEVWWSRFVQPTVHSWVSDEQPLRLHQQTKSKDDPDPKALACYGLLVRQPLEDQMLLRFVDGRPVSALTTQFLEWSCLQLQEQGIKALFLVWDNASWHTSRLVQTWIKDHNRTVKRQGNGVRILPCFLPVKSPWLNPIEPKWMHAKRAVSDPIHLLSAHQLADRVSDYFQIEHLKHLSLT